MDSPKDKEPDELVRKPPRMGLYTVRLFEEDVEFLKMIYPTMGYNRVVRSLVRLHVKTKRKQLSRLGKELHGRQEPD